MITLRDIEVFLDKHNIARTRFGRLVAHDPRLVDDMRRGREPRESIRNIIEQFMNNYNGNDIGKGNIHD